MPIDIEEIGEGYGPKISGAKTNKPNSREKVFRIFGTHDEAEAYYRLASHVYNGFARLGRLVVENIEVEEDSPGADLWTGTVHYHEQPKDKKKLLDDFPDYSFSTKGGKAKVTHSLQTLYAGAVPEPVYEDENIDGEDVQRRKIKVGEYNRNVKPPNFYRGINYEKGTFQGVEKIVPAWSSTISVTVPYDFVTPQYARLLRMMTGCVNSKPFDTMAPGESLFMGCDGSTRVEEPDDDDEEDENEPNDWELTPEQLRSKYIVWDLKFEFCGSPNMRNIFINKIGPFNKRGWDYVWVLTEDREANADDEEAETPSDDTEEPESEPGDPSEPKFSTENITISAPRAVYVERLYSYADFAVLGLF